MKFEDLLFELNKQEIALSLDGDALVVRAPKKVMNDTIRSALVKNKKTIIDLINAGAYHPPSHRDVQVPANVITPASTAITPDMLPLIALTQSDIDR
ncbi:TubC N-terminal docking domain-related protein, partial [Rhizobium rhizogenes]|uniref:TubC N-terminal docking domain-related protein n=1 Tax=Rhizobium rhizogenes TaxID=359 RepID=UPI00115E64E0